MSDSNPTSSPSRRPPPPTRSSASTMPPPPRPDKGKGNAIEVPSTPVSSPSRPDKGKGKAIEALALSPSRPDKGKGKVTDTPFSSIYSPPRPDKGKGRAVELPSPPASSPSRPDKGKRKAVKTPTPSPPTDKGKGNAIEDPTLSPSPYEGKGKGKAVGFASPPPASRDNAVDALYAGQLAAMRKGSTEGMSQADEAAMIFALSEFAAQDLTNAAPDGSGSEGEEVGDAINISHNGRPMTLNWQTPQPMEHVLRDRIEAIVIDIAYQRGHEVIWIEDIALAPPGQPLTFEPLITIECGYRRDTPDEDPTAMPHEQCTIYIGPEGADYSQLRVWRQEGEPVMWSAGRAEWAG